MSKVFTKDPDAVLDFAIDWTAWLAGDTIDTSTWAVPAGITKDSDTNSTTAAFIWLSGGTRGKTYTLTNRIVTVGLRTEDRVVKVRVRDNQ